MKQPFLLRQMRGRAPVCIGVAVLNFALALLLYSLYAGDVRMEQEIDAVYRQKTVTCSVTNLTGTQSDSLALPEWVIRLFLGDETFRADPHEIPFQNYIADPQAKVTLHGTLRETPVSLVGLTSLQPARELRAEEGCVITWLDGYSEEILSTQAAVCLLPEELYRQVRLEAGQNLTLTAVGTYHGASTAQLTVSVAGTYSGAAQDAIYLPWKCATELCKAVNGHVQADCISATIQDNRKIDEFWEVCAGRYFVKPDPEGTPVSWDSSPVYETYPYALAVYDDGLVETVNSLQHHQKIFRLCISLLVALTAVLGVVVSHLIFKHRERELALQQLLGLSKLQIFIANWLELLGLHLTGLAAGVLSVWLACKVAPPWHILGLFLAANCLGTVIAMCVFLHKDLVQCIKGAE